MSAIVPPMFIRVRVGASAHLLEVATVQLCTSIIPTYYNTDLLEHVYFMGILLLNSIFSTVLSPPANYMGILNVFFYCYKS